MTKDNKEIKESSMKERKFIYKNRAEQNDKEEKMANRVVKWVILSALVIIILVGLFLTFMMTTGGIGKSEEVSVSIPSGATSGEIASILEENDVIFSAPLFTVYMRLTAAPGIQAGNYDLMTSQGYGDAINKLAEGTTATSDASLVIPEGSNISSVASIISEVTGYSEEEVMKVIEDETFFEEMLAKYPDLLGSVAESEDVRYKLEGYLFPATYDLQTDQSIESILDAMLAKSDEIRGQHAEEITEAGLDYHELLTLASLIEAEASTPEDRRKISGVFYNRLAIDMPIQSDISILYANETHSAYVTIEDTEVDSAYNLYQNSGLGPGPFNNPGSDAIDAALNPEASDNYYFVADLRTGEVYYSKTYEEHNELVEQYVTEENADL